MPAPHPTARGTGVAAKELYQTYSMGAALISAALMAVVAGGLVPVVKSKAKA